MKEGVILLDIKEERIVHDTLFKIAHEVKNPLAVALGYLQMLNCNIDGAPRYVPRINDEVKRSVGILDDFLNCTKISIEKDTMDLYFLIEETVDSLKDQFRSDKVLIDCLIDDRELYIDADYDKLRQVLVNVLKNAYEANSTMIKVFTEINSDNVVIYVIDNGDGIKEENIARIGEMFFTTKISGTGIGVNFSREIVKLHGGNFSIANNRRGGVVVTISLPL